MYVVLCRGDLNDAELEVLGPFESEELARQFSKVYSCPNEHEVYEVVDVRT